MDLHEISISQRMNRKRNMRVMQPKLQRLRKIALSRRADQKTIDKRARKRAINIVYKKLARQMRSKIPVSRKADIEKKIAKKTRTISRIAKKLRRVVVRDAINRIASKNTIVTNTTTTK
jgi:hypothetical protein